MVKDESQAGNGSDRAFPEASSLRIKGINKVVFIFVSHAKYRSFLQEWMGLNYLASCITSYDWLVRRKVDLKHVAQELKTSFREAGRPLRHSVLMSRSGHYLPFWHLFPVLALACSGSAASD